MGTTWDIQIRVTKGIIILNLIIIGISVILLENWKPFVVGNIFGFIIAILNFRLLAIATERSLSMNSQQATRYAVIRYFIRLTITGLVIYVSLTTKHINTIGTIIGLLSIKPILLKESFFEK